MLSSLQHSEKLNHKEFVKIYSILNRTIDELDNKVDTVIEKHEAQFLHAYRNNMNRIKGDLKELKFKTDEQEKKITDNDRAYYLERQLIVFREEALKLYDRLDQKTQEAELYQMKVKDLEKSVELEKNTVKDLIKETKTLEGKVHVLKLQNQKLKQSINEQTSKLKNTKKQKTPAQTTRSLFHTLTTRNAKTLEQKQMQTLTYLSESEKKVGKIPIYENELKEWFIQCIRTIKKDVAFRKNTPYQFDLSQIGSFEEFKMVDKLRLLEKFMENEKLLVWMYSKIFPTRTDELTDYLSQRTHANPQKSPTSSQEPFFEEQALNLTLPKMSLKKPPKQKVRNTVQIKDGKLNISLY